MKNVTVTMDEETLRWARVEAAKQGLSLSRMTCNILRERRAQEAGYAAAMQRFLNRDAGWASAQDSAYPARGDLYDRSILR